MSYFHKRMGGALVFGAFIFGWAMVSSSPALAANEIRNPHAIAYADAWKEGAEYIHEGQFDQAYALLLKIARKSIAPTKAEGWLDKWLEYEKDRQKLAHADYESYVQRAKKWFSKDDLDKALKWTYYAMLNTSDEKAFRDQAWVRDIRDKSMVEAKGLLDEHKWRDAHAMYYSLSAIFEDDKKIDELRKQCLEHARLDEIYKSDHNWKESLEGIEPSMVEDALWRIDQKYVVEADFRQLTIAGFK